MKTNLSSYQSRILWAIFRQTYGFQKKEDWISNSRLCDLTGLLKQHVSRTIRELRERNLVTKGGYKIAFQKDYQLWRELPRGVTSHHSNREGLPQLPKGVTKVTKGGEHKRRNISKDIGRDPSNPAVNEFQTHFHEAFKEKIGYPYTPQWAKEGKLSKDLLKIHSLERLKELTEIFFKTKDLFIQKSGFTIGVFCSQINKLAATKVSRW